MSQKPLKFSNDALTNNFLELNLLHNRSQPSRLRLNLENLWRDVFGPF